MVELLRELRKTHSPVYCIIKAMIKDADEQPDEELLRAKPRRTAGVGTSIPLESRMWYPPDT